jgi:hypothetical protein
LTYREYRAEHRAAHRMGRAPGARARVARRAQNAFRFLDVGDPSALTSAQLVHSKLTIVDEWTFEEGAPMAAKKKATKKPAAKKKTTKKKSKK